MTLTYAQAKAAVAAAVTDQDNIRENLLDLDRSFGKRLLAGASLSGETRKRWEAAAAELAALWQLFAEYSAIVDRVADMTGKVRKSGPRLSELTELLTGKSVKLTGTRSPRARKDITGGGDTHITVAEAVQEMRRTYADVAEVVNIAETVWNEAADRVTQARASLDEAKGKTAGFDDSELTTAVTVAEQDLAELRELLTCDPLALWRDGSVDLARFEQLGKETAAVAARAEVLAQLRQDADGRISALASVIESAANSRADAIAARERSAVKIAVDGLADLPDTAALADRMATLGKLREAGRWTRLLSELDVIEHQAAAACEQCREAEREAAGLLDRRDELRGLLDAYRARAGSLGAAEDRDLQARYDRAHGLLWSAPCDLPAASDAVSGFQQAVLALARQKQRGQRQENGS